MSSTRKFPLFLIAVSAVLAVAGTAFASVPSAPRMLAPTLFGFRQVAPDVYAPADMDAARRDAVLAMIDASQKRVERFFDAKIARPRIVLCPKSSCDGAFGRSGAAGMAYGWFLVRLDEKGLNPMIVTHELSHVAVKSKVGALREIEGAVPAWFDEGLATYVSQDDRFKTRYPAAILDKVQASGPWWRWGRTVSAVGWQNAYGGALALIRRLDAQVGDKGLAAIVARVGGGQAFSDAIAAQKAHPDGKG